MRKLGVFIVDMAAQTAVSGFIFNRLVAPYYGLKPVSFAAMAAIILLVDTARLKAADIATEEVVEVKPIHFAAKFVVYSLYLLIAWMLTMLPINGGRL